MPLRAGRVARRRRELTQQRLVVQAFGGGQTQVTLDLPPGQHTLQLVMGDANHVPHDPPVMSEVITITVE